MSRPLALAIVVGLLLAVSSAAQTSVLSVIKPNRSGDVTSSLGVPFDGKFAARNVTPTELIAAAYGGGLPLDAAHILGLPVWTRTARFDVEARLENAVPTGDPEDDSAILAAFAMVRLMLAERFALKVHDTTRQEPVYALVRTGGRDPASLKPTARDCDAIARAGPFVELKDTAGRSLGPCGVRVRLGDIVATGATMAQLAQRLAPLSGINRQVVDRTGLTGRFDFTLQWTPPQAPPIDAGGVAPIVETGTSIFTALQEQLGLRLESQRGPARMLVIDRIERPTPN